MYKSLLALSILGVSSLAHAGARKVNTDCAPEHPPCYAADCSRCYCLGPDNYGANAPVNPKTCDGDWRITLAGFYWNAHQDGMEYAVDNRVKNPNIGTANIGTAIPATVLELNNLIDAEYKVPNYSWDLGFKFGIGYASTCDGWDFGILWTWFQDGASDHIEAEIDDNHTLLPLWSAFASGVGSVLYATDIETFWKLNLNLVDIELGRNFWTSRLVSLRPFIGLRFASIDQNYEIQHKGGSWSAIVPSQEPSTVIQAAFNNEVDLRNEYHGVGLRAGLDSYWNLGCGWALSGNLASSIVYGRFKVEHDEENRLAQNPHPKTKILETTDTFRASRAMLDLALGIQWSGLFCECKYGISVALAWEHHMFFDQNQMWRVNRIGDVPNPADEVNGFFSLPNNTGENTYHQRRGDLSTQGWTLSFRFDF